VVADPGGGPPEAAQVSLDRFWSTTGDARLRSPSRIEDPPTDGSRPRWPAVGELAEAEALLALPALPFPATIEVTAPVDHQASVAFRGNRYSVPPGLAGVTMTLRQRLGTATLDVVSPAGVVLVTHRLAPAEVGTTVRTPAHREALEKVVVGAFSTARPCDRKENRPPGSAALAERAKLLGAAGVEPSVDLAELAEVIRLAFPGTTTMSGGEVSA